MDHHHHQHHHLPPSPPPLSAGATSWPFLWEPQDQAGEGGGVAELREAVVRATAELESTRAAAEEELRVAQGRALHLAALLDSTARERDQFRRHCHSLLLLLSHHLHHHNHHRRRRLNPSPPPPPAPTHPPNPNPNPSPFVDDLSNASEEEEGSNNGSSPPPAAALEAEVEAGAARRGLPEKGRLVEAVVAAGPLLQTLLLAGSLPRWRHPPPPLLSFEIPPVAASLNPNPSPSSDDDNNNNNIADPDATPTPPLRVMASASSSPESTGCELQQWYHHSSNSNNNNNNNNNNYKLNSFYL